jgi:mono/diheme cytochrome c family protein
MKERLRCSFGASVGALALILVSGCRQDMHNQPKMISQRHSAFFQDGRSARLQVAGTVSRSQGSGANYFTTGLMNGAEGDALPFAATYDVLQRGEERFNIYCSPCHSRVGNGKGAIVGRGYYAAGNFQSARLRQAPLGHFFWVMTHGYGAMPNYSAELQPEDRWAITAYIRALQLSQSATRADVPQGVTVAHMGDLLQHASLSRDFMKEWDTSVDADSDESTAPAPASPVALAQPTSKPAESPLTSDAKTPVAATAKHDEAATASAPSQPGQAKETAAAAQAAPKGDVAHGKVLYTNNCSACHQPTRAGLPPVFPSLIGIVEKDGEGKVRKLAKEGVADAKPPMPPHPDLTASDLDDLIAFLRTK